MDIVGAALILLVGAPFWLLIALAIKLDSPGPVLYRQQRIGYRGTRFACLKFRSMYARRRRALARYRARPWRQPTNAANSNCEMTHVVRSSGRFLRRTSLDEIPQLLSVLRGEMSLVGPRPPLVVEYERYEDWEKGRLEMLTGHDGTLAGARAQ